MVSNVSGFNPYYNDLFLSQLPQFAPQVPQQVDQQVQQQVPEGDKRSSLVKVGAAGVGAAVGGYVFANPLQDANTFKDSFVKSYEEVVAKNKINREIINAQKNVLKNELGITTEQFNALKLFTKEGDISKLPESVQKLIPDSCKNLDAAKEAIKKAEEGFAKIDKSLLSNNIRENIKTFTGNVHNETKLFEGANKKFAAEASPKLTKALKNFKLKQAGKWGLIAAGAVVVGRWLFGK